MSHSGVMTSAIYSVFSNRNSRERETGRWSSTANDSIRPSAHRPRATTRDLGSAARTHRDDILARSANRHDLLTSKAMCRFVSLENRQWNPLSSREVDGHQNLVFSSRHQCCNPTPIRGQSHMREQWIAAERLRGNLAGFAQLCPSTDSIHPNTGLD